MCPAAATGSIQTVPDPRGGGVEDAAVGDVALLADRLPGVVGAIHDADHQLVRTITVKRVGDVEGERIVAAPMRTHQGAIDPHRGVVVDRLEREP